MYAEHACVKANRVDPQFVDHKGKQVCTIEMSFPWVENRGKKSEEKTSKHSQLRWELKRQYPSYDIEQCNIDVLAAPTKYLPRRQVTMKIKLADQLTESMKEGGFHLTKFTSYSRKLLYCTSSRLASKPCYKSGP